MSPKGCAKNVLIAENGVRERKRFADIQLLFGIFNYGDFR